MLLAVPAWAGIDPPNTVGCREKSEKDFHEHTHMKKDKGPAQPKAPKTGYRPQRSQWGRREGKR